LYLKAQRSTAHAAGLIHKIQCNLSALSNCVTARGYLTRKTKDRADFDGGLRAIAARNTWM
jgi:hypothetical protein